MKINDFNIKAMKSLFTVLFFIIMGCSRPPSAGKELVIGMEKTACFGPCPVYKMEIRSDRTLWYSGKSNVPVVGEKKVRLSQNEFNNIRNEFINAKFFEFASSYISQMPDFPTVYIEFHDGDKQKKVKDYYGAPARLKELEGMVEALVKEKIWDK